MAKPAHRRSGPTFEEIAASVPAPDPSTRVDVPAAAGRSWADPDGVIWVRRGEACTASRARRLFAEADVRVVHRYDDDIRDVPPTDRPALWARVAPYLGGARRERSDHTDFVVTEFRDHAGRRLLVVEERC